MKLNKDKKPVRNKLQELVKKLTETTYFDYVKPLTKVIRGKP